MVAGSPRGACGLAYLGNFTAAEIENRGQGPDLFLLESGAGLADGIYE